MIEKNFAVLEKNLSDAERIIKLQDEKIAQLESIIYAMQKERQLELNARLDSYNNRPMADWIRWRL